MKMSRKQMLTKKVAHTLLAMSIVSVSGLNMWAGTAWAAADGDKGDDASQHVEISDSYTAAPVKGEDGKPGAAGSSVSDNGGNGGKGGNASLSGDVTITGGSSKDASLTVQGGNGSAGGGWHSAADDDVKGGNGGDGGNAELQLSITTAVDMGALSAQVTAGAGGSSTAVYSGIFNNVTGGDGGAGGKATSCYWYSWRQPEGAKHFADGCGRGCCKWRRPYWF